jgi:hypothetical protein
VSHPGRTGLLLAAGALQLVSWVWVRSLGDLAPQVHALWLALLPALCGYVIAAALLLRGRAAGPPVPGGLAILVGIAVGARLLLLGTEPSLSDDIYRYVWDGRVQLAGHNPYGQPPDDPSLAGLRDADWERINHPELVTVYPPAAQWWFALSQAVWPGVTGMKAGFVLCDLLLMAVLWTWLRRRGQAGERLVLYAWHPLPVLEIAGNGHVDILGVLLLCLACLWLGGGRRLAAVLALSTAVLTKLIPVLCAAGFWGRLRDGEAQAVWSRLDPRPRLLLLLVPALTLAALLPYVDAGGAMWSGLSAYASKWRFNDSAFGWLYALLADPAPGWEWDDDALRAARWLCLAASAGVALWTALRNDDDLAAACATVMGAYLLLSPTVHPWYVLWVLPFLALRATPAWMAFSWLVLLAYDILVDYRATGLWQESSAIRWLEYGPVYGLLAWQALRRWRPGRNARLSGPSL